jgi:AraC-like DNA-binding protein
MSTYFMYVERYRRLFLETKNPLYAWRAFENARRMGHDIPDEILDHIAGAAHDIVKVAQDPPRPAERPIALAKALRLHKTGAGQGSPFTEYSKRLQDRKLALDVVGSEFYDPDLLDYAFDDVSERSGISKSTVRRVFKKQREYWQQIAKDMIEADAVTYGPNGKPQMAAIGTSDDLKEASEILKEVERLQTSA